MQEIWDETSKIYKEISTKEAECMKKLTQIKFELHLEKESFFTVAWPEESNVDMAHFDLCEFVPSD